MSYHFGMKKSDRQAALPAASLATSPQARCAARLRSAVSHLHRQLRCAPAEAISVAKLSALAHIYRAGSITPSELARRERVKLQSLTRLLAELQEQGWLARAQHESDARQTLLSLTRSGVRALSGDARRREGMLTDARRSRLTEEEVDSLSRACALIDRIADGINDDQAEQATAVAAMSARLFEEA